MTEWQILIPPKLPVRTASTVLAFVVSRASPDVRDALPALSAIERACEQVLTLSRPSYQAVKRILTRQATQEEARAAAGPPSLQQAGQDIRGIEDYRLFWEEYSLLTPSDPSSVPPTTDRREDDVNVDP